MSVLVSVTVIESAAEAADQTAVTEKNEPMRLTAPQQSEKHRLPPESVEHQLQATRPNAPQPECRRQSADVRHLFGYVGPPQVTRVESDSFLVNGKAGRGKSHVHSRTLRGSSALRSDAADQLAVRRTPVVHPPCLSAA